MSAIYEFAGVTFRYIATLAGSQNVGPALRILSVQRDTRGTCSAGSVVHQVSNSAGATFTLIGADAQFLQNTGFAMDVKDSFGSASIPTGWTYSRTVLSAPLILAPGGLATVCSSQGNSLWDLTVDAAADGVTDAADNCLRVANAAPANSDAANHGGDACDRDDHNDGIADNNPDNCRTVPNTEQTDSDGGGCGDACTLSVCDTPLCIE